MFGISFGEISLVLVVAAIIFGPEEVVKVLKVGRKVLKKIHLGLAQVKLEVSGILEEEGEEKVREEVIVDLYGNEQRTYSLQEVKTYLKSNNSSTTVLKEHAKVENQNANN